MPDPQENEAVVWDSIDWKGIEAEAEQHRRDDEEQARSEVERPKAAGVQPTGTEIERAKLEAERQTLANERKIIETERKRFVDVEATRRADDARRSESDRIDRERDEHEVRTQRESEERSRYEEDSRLQRAREERGYRDNEARQRKAQEEKMKVAEEEKQRRAHEQRVTPTNQSTPPALPGGALPKPWRGADSAPAPETVKPRTARFPLSPLFQATINETAPPPAEPSPPLPSAMPVASPPAPQPSQPEEKPPAFPLAPCPPKKSILLGPAFGTKKAENFDKESAD
jgi:hypothetical protein